MPLARPAVWKIDYRHFKLIDKNVAPISIKAATSFWPILTRPIFMADTVRDGTPLFRAL